MGDPPDLAAHRRAPASAALFATAALTNGDFEAGNLRVGWTTGGAGNNSETRVLDGSNHVARVDVGAGPFEDSCTNPGLNNFAFIDQLFHAAPGTVELDFLVPPPIADPTETASCPGFDRVEIDFEVVQPNPFALRLLSAVLIDYSPEVGRVTGILVMNDFVTGARAFAQFDPASSAPVSAGPLSLEPSAALTGWTHAKIDLSTAQFRWLSSDVVFRVTVRNEDNGNTGQQFSVSVDNVTAPAPSVRVVAIDIKPGSTTNPFNCLQPQTVLPVAILSSADFDATDVDVSTVRFGPSGTEAAPLTGAHVEDVDGDGRADLVLQFREGDAGLSFICFDSGALLSGTTTGGEHFRGSDFLTQVGRSF
ncbi:MAG: hypothetical protein ACJ79H_13960 [Myxococcales bacterium]